MTVDRFVIGSLLGAGGTAAVFRARDTVAGREVALRALHAHLAADPAVVQQFVRQARATLGLCHPHLVGTLDVGRSQGVVWSTQELVEGATLAEVLDLGPMPAADALRVIVGVLDGLAYAHARGVLHLDLSATNVMVPRGPGGPRHDGAVVLDLGGTASRGDVVRVSAHFASPEVATAAPAGPAADVYSAACLLHHLVTGRPPFVADHPRQVLAQHVDSVPPAPSTLVPGLPAALDRLVARGMAKDPAARPGAARLAAQAAALLAAVGPTPAAAVAGRGGPHRDPPMRVTPVLVAVAGYRPPVLVAVAGYRPPVPAVEHPPARRDPSRLAVLGVALTLVVGWGVVSAAVSGSDPAPRPVPAVARRSSPTAAPSPSCTASVSPAAARVLATIVVPSSEGLTLDDAAAALTAAGLLVDVTQQDGPSVAGTVLGSDPAAGAGVAAGDIVHLLVASGRTTVPDVVGLGLPAARSVVEAAGLVADLAVLPTEGAVPPTEGTVLASDPRAGTPVDVGSVVVLLRPAPAPTGGPAPTTTPSPTSGPVPTSPP